MIVIENKTLYKCEHCRKKYEVKSACEKHERICSKNPAYLKPCHSCTNCKKVKTYVPSGYSDFYGNESEREVDILFCDKISTYVHSPKVAAKGNAFVPGDFSNVVFPDTCEFYTSNGTAELLAKQNY